MLAIACQKHSKMVEMLRVSRLAIVRDRGCVGAGRPPILDGVTTRTKSSCLLGAEIAATAVRATGPGLDAIGASHDMASNIIRARR